MKLRKFFIIFLTYLQLIFNFQVKAGDSAARTQLLKLQCGFEKSLPKVCCQSSIGATETPRIFVNSGNVPTSTQSSGTNLNVLTPTRNKSDVPTPTKTSGIVGLRENKDSDTKTDPTPFTTSTTTTVSTNRPCDSLSTEQHPRPGLQFSGSSRIRISVVSGRHNQGHCCVIVSISRSGAAQMGSTEGLHNYAKKCDSSKN